MLILITFIFFIESLIMFVYLMWIKEKSVVAEWKILNEC